MRLTFVAVSLGLIGCAGMPDLLKSSAPEVWVSSQPVTATAACVALAANSSLPPERMGKDHFTIMRNNDYGNHVVRYDVYTATEGARVEFRRATKAFTGIEQARLCL